MPTYEYQCPVHGAFDEIRAIADRNDPMACPECGLLCERNTIAVRANVTPLTQELRDFYGDAADAITAPWDRVPEFASVGDVHRYFRVQGVSPDNIVPSKEWRDHTGRHGIEAETGISLDRRKLFGRR